MGQMARGGRTKAWRVLGAAVAVLAFACGAAADPGDGTAALLGSLEGARSSEKPRLARTDVGTIRFVAAPPGARFGVGMRAADGADAVALAFVEAHPRALGVDRANLGFRVRSIRGTGARAAVRLDALAGDLPIFGAQALVQVRGGGVEAALLDLPHDPRIGEIGRTAGPELDARAAERIAVDDLASEHPSIELGLRAPAELMVFAPGVLDLSGPARLAWRVDVGAPMGRPAERYLVDARTGAILLRYSLAHGALDRQVFDADNSMNVPAIPARAEGDPATGEPEVDEAYDFSGDTYLFYANEHGRDGLDDAGTPMQTVVRYCPRGNCFVDDAVWDGTRSLYTVGMAADDVVGHEFTHGVTQHTSDLIYYRQSGAIDEAFADLWGELIDQGNGAGNDSAFARWLIGEDAATGTLRNMQHPPAYGDPDRTCSSLYFEGDADNGGVHVNSGIVNKLSSLLVDGGSFNGFTISGMGGSAVADLFYEAQTSLLVPASDFVDLYFALTQAAVNLGLPEADRDRLEDAMRAVEIDPASNCQPPPPVPVNDECADAVPITYGTVSGYTDESSDSGAPGCAPKEDGDVWYVFSATTDETVTFSTCAYANFDTSISVFESCGGARIVCNDDDGTCGTTSSATVDVTAGQDYYVRISGYDGLRGDFVLTLTREGEDGSGCGGDLLDVFDADFESDLGGMTATGLWHRTETCFALDLAPASEVALGFMSDATCDYDTGQSEQGYATTPPLDLTTAEGEVRASLEHLLSWSGEGESAAVEISTDGGGSWDTLVSTMAPPFLYSSSGWTCLDFDLSDYAGEVAQMRFAFDTGGASAPGEPGFYIDELRIEAEGYDGEAVTAACGEPGRTLHHDDFENGDEGYARTGLWHRSSACAAERPSHPSEAGLYAGHDDTCTFDAGTSQATSLPIDLTDATGLLSLSLRYHLDSRGADGLDVATVEVSSDGGGRWFELASSAGVPELVDGGGVWKCGTYNLSPFAGSVVHLRFTLSAVLSASSSYAGLFVDDVRIAQLGCTDADEDGYAVEGGACGPIDCNDGDGAVNPGAAEIPANGIDDDCDPATPAGCSAEP